MKKDLLLNVAVVVMACCALVVTGLVIRREFFGSPATAATTGPVEVKDWQRFLSPGTRIGPADAPVTIIEFSDFQCPFCARHAETLRRIRGKYGNQVAIVFRHFPLTGIHPHATDAALAAECAGAQQRFEPYHDVLFQRQDSIGSTAWNVFARDAAVPDTVKFQRCMRDREHAGRIEQDVAAGRSLGVTATPTTVINGTRIAGMMEEAAIVAMIEEALQEAR